LVVLMTMKADQDDLTPTRVGRSLFSTFLLVQYLIVLFVFPAFSAMAFSDERSSGSLDLLTTTRLSPSELVSGKFLASLVFCLLYVIGSVPLLAIAFLFGGVTPLEVLVGYSSLTVATLLVSILGVCVSSFAIGNVQSVLMVYCLSVFMLVRSFLFLGGTEALDQYLAGEQTPVGPLLDLLGHGSPLFALQSLGWIVVVGLFFGYLFQFASRNVTVGSGDQSIALRVLTSLAVPAILVLAGLSWLPDSPTQGMESLVLLAAALLFASAWLFSGESIAASVRQRGKAERLRGVRFAGRLFLPGSACGAAFSIVLAVLVCALGLVVWNWLAPDRQSHDWIAKRIVESLLTIPIGVVAFSAFGFFLSSQEFAPRYARLTSLFTAIIVFLLPLVFLLRRTADAVWTFYYLSPITLWFSAEPQRPDEQDVLLELFGYDLFHVARVVYGVLSVVILALACRAYRKRLKSSATGR